MSISVINYSEKITDPNSSIEENYLGIKRCVRLNNVYSCEITCLVRGTSSLVALRNLVNNGDNYVFFPDTENATGGFTQDMCYVTTLPGWTINPYGEKSTNIVTINIVETRD